VEIERDVAGTEKAASGQEIPTNRVVRQRQRGVGLRVERFIRQSIVRGDENASLFVCDTSIDPGAERRTIENGVALLFE